MNVLFPIAGLGKRFTEFGYSVPKPLVKVKNKTLLEYSLGTLGLDGNYIVVVLKYENESFNREIRDVIESVKPNSKIITIDSPTQGSSETCLYAKKFIDNEEELIVTNGDQYLNWDPQKFKAHIAETKPDGCVSTYDHKDFEIGKPSKYAFVSLDSNGYATKFQEKFAISQHAMNGIHYWKNGRDFVRTVQMVIDHDIRVNGEHYLSSSYNFLINEGKKINTFKMQNQEYCSLGSPEEINANLNRII